MTRSTGSAIQTTPLRPWLPATAEVCWNLVMLDVLESANIAAQRIGRVFRLKQKHRQNVWIVTVDHTYDQVIQARSAQKVYGQIAGTANTDVDHEVSELRKSYYLSNIYQ
ncbi:hypothetical protein H2199_008372 [Coniosporium tulheliwenetii]|uniref:Uncharacterized protein n=1 Tax=Coniosporium tulheliwenetii TaxID=3383036 RepID=A0ACC2YJM5_9PEZI|nr:hypothetical protein H2199_008372 [Cladosporium sp. JES 115]